MTSIAIDPNLSVFDLVQRTKEQRNLLNQRRTMLIISREIETTITQNDLRARVFAGFQRISRFIPQFKRYEALAHSAESVYVFGVMDVKPPAIDNVIYVPLMPSDQLAKEWFLIAESQDYFSGIATEEIEVGDQSAFRGVWTFDEEIVTILQEWLSSLVDAHPMGDLSKHRDYRQTVGLLTTGLLRLTTGLVGSINMLNNAGTAQTAKDISLIIKEQVGPAVKAITEIAKSKM
jgi:hypothetical protein